MYKHFIGLDWSQTVMAISRRTASGKEAQVYECPADVRSLRLYLSKLKGRVALTFEETTGAQWLYAQLADCVASLTVCDPYRNKLLSDGPKTDKIDASKLSKLLYTDMLKPVFHSGDELIKLRKIVSGYEDLIKSGVRNKNQLSALSRGVHNQQFASVERFVAEGHTKQIAIYEAERERYKCEFERLKKKFKPIRDVESIPGIGNVGAVRVVATVVDISRFSCQGKFLAYSGLITLEKESGGKSYGRKKPRYSRTLKQVFDAAAMSIINGKPSRLQNYYYYLIKENHYARHNAKKALARRIAVITYGVLKSKKRYDDRLIKN